VGFGQQPGISLSALKGSNMNNNQLSTDRSLVRDSARVISTLGSLPLSRREAIRRCLFGTAGLLLVNGWGLRSHAAARSAKARSVIQIWMWGGPCHIDTFDPKPGVGYDFCGPLTRQFLRTWMEFKSVNSCQRWRSRPTNFLSFAA
jgi:hypothetical protein